MPQQVPNPGNLREAVQLVIDQNRRVGYSPNRFRQITEDGEANDLVDVCDRQIRSNDTLHMLLDVMDEFPSLLTLEDLVVHCLDGAGLGIDVEMSRARVETFRAQVGRPRWQPGTTRDD